MTLYNAASRGQTDTDTFDAQQALDRLPVEEHEMTPTRSLKLAATLATVTLEARGLLAFDGPSGTGKSSTAVWIARQHPEWRWAYLQVPYSVRFSDVPGHVQEAITGYPAHGKVRDVQRENVKLLRHHRIGFIADEVQHAGTHGLQALRYLGDLTAMGPTGGTPIFLVGHGSLNAASGAPELIDRLVGAAEFTLLTGGALLEFAHALHPRFAASSDDIISRINSDCGGNGSLRSWHTIAGLLNRVSPNEPPHRPVTAPEVARIAMFRGPIANSRRKGTA